MNIALLSPLEESVPPERYGGIERVVYQLAQQLIALGHDVTLLASGDSVTPAKLIPITTKALRRLPRMNNVKIFDSLKVIGIAKIIAYVQKHPFDIIHNHFDSGWIQPFEYLLPTPMVTTLHGNLLSEYEYPVYKKFSKSRYVSISFNQRRALPRLNYIANVYNGLDFSRYTLGTTPKDYLVFLGSIIPHKGPLEAIQIARRCNRRLLIAAKLDERQREYYNSTLRPLIDGKQIRFIGEVNEAEKIQLLQGAQALIAPIQWDEPFGLYFTEAMACGTPVITLKRGATSEIIQHKKTGFVCTSLSGMIKAVQQIPSINRRDCYNHIHQSTQFTAAAMAKHYVSVYQQVIKN